LRERAFSGKRRYHFKLFNDQHGHQSGDNLIAGQNESEVEAEGASTRPSAAVSPCVGKYQSNSSGRVGFLLR
jgi:hypothetical protein